MTAPDREKALELLESTAKMLRGILFDPAIPRHAKEAMRSRVQELETFIEHALDEGETP